MKKILFYISIFIPFSSICCDVCQKNQPKLLKNIAHGTGPQSSYDLIIIWAAAIIVLITLILSLKLLIKPKEKNKDHIKNIILKDSL